VREVELIFLGTVFVKKVQHLFFIMKFLSMFCLFLLFNVVLNNHLLSQIPPTPSITVMNSTVGCPPNNAWDGVFLHSSATFGNLWSNGDTAQFVRITSTGSYSVTQTIAGLTSSPSAAVSVSIHTFSALFPSFGPLCTSDAPIALQGSPPGGIYMGNAIVGTNFIPSLANIGDGNILAYQVGQTFGNLVCYDTAYLRVVVSECVGLNEAQPPENVIRVWPNPESKALNIESGNELILGLKLNDLSGKTLRNRESVFQYSLQLGVEDLPAGVYLLELRFENQMHRQRILR